MIDISTVDGLYHAREKLYIEISLYIYHILHPYLTHIAIH